LLTLYEDNFGVVNPKTNESILTVGGLLSHFYRDFLVYNPDSHSSKKIVLTELVERLKMLGGNDIYKLSIDEFIEQIKRLLQENKIGKEEVKELFFCLKNFGIAINSPRFSESGEPLTPQDLKALESFNNVLVGDTGDDVRDGWLFLQTYSLLKNELTSEMRDERLINELCIKEKMNKMEVLQKSWKKARKLALRRGAYINSTDPNYKEAVKKLLALRISSEFSFLFERFTAVGLINSRNSSVSSPLQP